MTHIIDEILRLPSDSIMHYQREVMELLDLITMAPEDIPKITGRIKGVNYTLGKRDARLLLHFTWWYHDQSSRLLNSTLDDNYWFQWSHTDFLGFLREKVPRILAGKTSTSRQLTAMTTSGEVSAEAVLQFQKSIKLDVSQFPEFKGTLEGWLPFKRKLSAITATHGIDRIISKNLSPIVRP